MFGFSIRGLKIKDDKSDKSSIPGVNYYAGADIVLQNEESWREIHSRSLINIQKAEVSNFFLLVGFISSTNNTSYVLVMFIGG